MEQQHPDSEKDFKPAINPAELTSAYDQMPAPESYKFFQAPDKNQVELDREDRESRRNQLVESGFSQAEADSIIKNGQVMPEVFATKEASDAYIESQARTEKALSAQERARAEAAYADQRRQLAEHYRADGWDDQQVDNILTYGHFMPARFSETPATDLLAQRRQRKAA